MSRMLSRELMARLSRMHRQPLAATASSIPVGPSTDAGEAAVACHDDTQPPAGRVCETAWGSHWLIERPLTELWPRGAARLQSWQVPETEPRRADLQAIADQFPARVLLLDLETCGFAGSMVFLVGLMHYHAGGWQLSQLLARNYAEEKAMLQTLWRIAAGHQVLVTFNGKSFDWPVVHDRSTLHHLGSPDNDRPPVLESESRRELSCLQRHDPRPRLEHCDLLHHARRRWRGTLPNCRLQTLERYICGRQRNGDLPGRDIPAAYHDFVRRGDPQQIRSILHHNALDLVTLLQLAVCLLHPEPAS